MNKRDLFLVMVFSILVFSILDIVNTLKIISVGGTEENPLMDYFLNQGVVYFIAAKMIMVSIALGILTTIHLFYEKYVFIINLSLALINIGFIMLMFWQYYIIFFLI